MEINNPEITTLVQQVEGLQNRATILELETVRLQKLAIAEQYTIDECEKRKKELEGQIKSLEETYSNANSKLGLKQEELDSKLALIDEKNKLIIQLDLDIAEKTTIARQTKEKIDSEKADWLITLLKNKDKEEELKEKEEKLTETISKLKSLIDGL